jgi:hypothetical protein
MISRFKYKRAVTLAIAAMVLTAAAVVAQDADTTAVKGWKKSAKFDFTTTQTAYSDSWEGGEAGSFNWVANFNGSAERQVNPWFDIRSTLKLSFGQTMTQDEESKDWSKPKKSTDLIDWENVGSFTMHKTVDPYVAFRLESQFADASNPNKRFYFSPLKLTESAGVLRKIYEKDKDLLTSRLGIGLRQVFKSSYSETDNATVDSTYVDTGIESVTDATFQLSERLSYTGKLGLYKAVYFSKSDDVKGTPSEDDWKAVDVNWETIIAANISKIITVNLYTQVLYDKQISKKGRFKETLALGFVFNLI